MTVAIKSSPAHAPGQGVANAMRRSQKWAKAASVAFGDTSPVNLFEVPGDVLIVGGLVDVSAAFDGPGTSAAPTVVIGAPGATGAETLWNAADIGLLSTGLKPFSAFIKTPSSGGYVTATYTAGTTTAGAFQVYLSYVELADQL